jgi:hypothetical protein
MSMIVRRLVTFVVVALAVAGGILWWVADGDSARAEHTLRDAGSEARAMSQGDK